MCGIFAYIGNKPAYNIIKKGLKRMEYRGYDSWGTALLEASEDGRKAIAVIKSIGGISDDADEHGREINALVGIGHTRWATHGGVTHYNAHPHLSTDNSFALVQNGIVENFETLKNMLINEGFEFTTETDTEVIVRLIEMKLKSAKNFTEALRQAFLELEGRNTIVILEKQSQTLIGIRNGSPLVVGLGNSEEILFASDTLAFADLTNKIVFVENYEMVMYTQGQLNFYEAKTGKALQKKAVKIENFDTTISLEGYKHFMLKEIYEQQHTIKQAAAYGYFEISRFIEKLKQVEHIYTVGAGTASYTAAQIAYFLRTFAGLKAYDIKAYEMESYSNLFTKNDIVIAVSQSGETADTIEALEIAREKGTRIASIVNMMGSTVSRMSDYKFYSRTGPEICVASTKAFTAQLAWGYLIAMSVAGKYEHAQTQLTKLTDFLKQIFGPVLNTQTKLLADLIYSHEHFFVLGKGQNYVIALEGALKVKEITYKHFEGFAAGELKHGVIALVDKDTPVFCIISNDEARKDMISAAAEIKARGAFVVGIGATSNSDFFDFKLEYNAPSELSSLVNVIPFQLLSYYLALKLGNNIDKPRNLAKSVTVK